MKFRKKPIVIDAEQWFPGNHIEGLDYDYPINSTEWYYLDYAYVPTLEGRMKVSEGDWIITGVRGEKYPCKPDIFEQTYERVEE